MKKLWFRRTIQSLAAAALFLVIALCLLLTPFGKQYVFRQILRSLNGGGAGFRIEASLIDVDYIQGSATLANIVVQSGDGKSAMPEPPPFFYAERVSADIDVTKALRGVWKIEDLVLTHPDVRCLIDAEGRSNLPGSSGSSSGSLPDILVASTDIRDGAFVFEDRRQGLSASLPRWNVVIAGDGKTRVHHIEFEELEPAEFQYGGAGETELSLRTLRFAADLNLPKGSLTIPSARIATGEAAADSSGVFSDISGNVDFSRPGAPFFDVEIRPSLNLRHLAQIVKLGQPFAGELEGKVDGRVRATGDGSRLDVSAQLKAANLAVPGWRTKELALELQSQWRREAGRLTLSDFTVSTPEGTVAGKADLTTLGASGQNSVAVAIKDLDLRTLGRFVSVPFDLASRATGDIGLQWDGSLEKFDLDKATANAAIDLHSDRAAPDAGALPLSGRLEADLRAGALKIEVPSLRAMGLEAAGRLSLQNLQNSPNSHGHQDSHDIAGEFEGGGADVGQTMSQLALLLGEPSASGEPDEPDAAGLPPVLASLSGPVRFRLQAEGSLEQPEIAATLETPELVSGEGELADVSLKSNFLWQGSSLRFDGDLGLPQDSRAAFKGDLEFDADDPILALDFQAGRVPVTIVNDLAKVQIPAAGTVDVSAILGGSLSRLAGTAQVHGNGLSVYGEPLGELTAELTLADNVVRSKEFRLLRDRYDDDYGREKGAGDALDAQFSYALDTGRYEIKAQGKGLVLHNPDLLPAVGPLPGKIDLDLSGEGTLDEPRLRVRLETDDLRMELGARPASLGSAVVTADLAAEDVGIGVTLPGVGISADVEGKLRAPYPFTGEVQAKGFDIGILGLELRDGQPLGGSLSTVIRAAGELAEIEGTELDADILDLSLKAQNLQNAKDPENQEVQTVRLFSPARMELKDNVLAIPSPLLMVSSSSQLELSGSVPLRETDDEETLQLKGRVELADVFAFVPVPEGLAVTGVLNLDLGVSVLRQVFGGSGEISVERGVVEIPGSPLPLTGINAKANVEDGALVLRQATAKWGNGDISLAGELPFSILPQPVPGLIARDGPVRFNLAISGLTPEMTGMFPPELKGRVSLHAEGSAAQADPRSLRAEIVFDEIAFKVGTLDFHQQEPARLEIGDGVASVARFKVVGPETNLNLGGSAEIFPNSEKAASLDLKLDGYLDAALLTFADPDLKAAGRLDIEMAAGGTLAAPSLSGHVETSNGRLSLATPRILADDLHVRLGLSPEKITVERLDGLLNGGTLTGEGTIGYGRGLLGDIDLRATFQDFFLEAPEGLKSASSGTITIKSEEDAIVIGGNVRVTESAYQESLEVGGQVMNYLKSQQVMIVDATPNPLLSRIRYDIGVRTTTPLLMRNNVARVEATSNNLRVVGTYYEPSVTGRVTLTEGGEIILNNREYFIDRGIVTFANQTRVEPELDIQAKTTIKTKDGDYDITLRLAGNPDRLTTTFASEPSDLSERDILSLLVTGRKIQDGEAMQAMQTQALSLLAGQAGEQLTGEARKALHLSTFRIDPEGIDLIASESDPGARLTIGEDITRDLSLAYSMNLVNGGDQIWAAQYAVTRRLTTQATKQQDNSYRFEFRHDFRFGGGGQESGARGQGQGQTAAKPQRARNTKFEIGTIRFTGEERFPEKMLSDRLGAESGDRYDFSKIQKGLDRLQAFYVKEGRLEADIRMRRETKDATVDLELAIAPGPVVRFSFEGFPVSTDMRKAVEQAWQDGVFDAGRIEDAVAILRRLLIKDGYHEARITSETETSQDGQNYEADQNYQNDDIRNVRFHIEPGVRYSNVAIRLPGASGIREAALRKAIDDADLVLDVYAGSRKVVDYLQGYYRERGYLEARVSEPQAHLDQNARTGEVAIEVKEGPQFVIGDLEFIGNQVFDYDKLWVAIPTSSGSIYDPNTLRNALKAIESLYHSQGYNEVSTTFRVVQDTPNALAHLTFQITERRQSFIGDLVIEGNRRTSLYFVTRQLDFQKGDILDFEKVNESRRRLYATGAFSSVDFQTEEITENAEATENADDDAIASGSNRKSTRVRLRLRENTPYRMQYGLFYDTERGPGGLLEMQDMNVMGRASNLGFRLRYDANLKEGRVYYNQPFVRMLHLKMDASAFIQQEERSSYRARRIGFSLMKERALPKEYRLDYGYRYDHVRWEPEDVALDPTIFQANVPVARLIATLTRDTRDNVLDATTGEFTTHTVEFGPGWLGSEIGFSRYSGQYFRYTPIDKYLKLKTKDDEGNPLPAKFVYAGALRFGLTSSFGGRDLISPERFFAGGGTTLRGFEQDLLGPVERQEDGSLRPKGGEGLFLLNNEIRFPIWSILHGVGFLDIGNVYPRIGDFDFSMRKTAGAGLRLKIKFIPLRFDYGFKLDRRPGESGSAFFFSIGQAF